MLEFLVYPLIIYLTAGLAIATLLALGVARTEIRIEILHREVEPGYAHVALLVMTVMFWPVVVWMLLAGRRQDRAMAQAEIDRRADEQRVQRFAASANVAGVARAVGLAEE